MPCSCSWAITSSNDFPNASKAILSSVEVVVVNVCVVVVVVVESVEVVKVVVVVVLLVLVVNVRVVDVRVLVVRVVEVHPPSYEAVLLSQRRHRWLLLYVAGVEMYSPSSHCVMALHCLLVCPARGARYSYSSAPHSVVESHSVSLFDVAFSTLCSSSLHSDHSTQAMCEWASSSRNVP